MQLSEKIKFLREKEKLSQAKFSEKIGVKMNTVWRWETGKAIPQIRMLQKIAEVFQIPLSYLVDEKNEILISSKFDKKLSLANKIKEINDQNSSQTVVGFADNLYTINNNGLSVQLPITPQTTEMINNIINRMINDITQKNVIGNSIIGDNNINNQLDSVINQPTEKEEENHDVLFHRKGE